MMKRIVLSIVLAIGIAWIVSETWWNLWVYHGFVGSPSPLRELVDKYHRDKGMLVDGETGYDMEGVAMMIVTFPVVIILVFAFQLGSLRLKSKETSCREKK